MGKIRVRTSADFCHKYTNIPYLESGKALHLLCMKSNGINIDLHCSIVIR